MNVDWIALQDRLTAAEAALKTAKPPTNVYLVVCLEADGEGYESWSLATSPFTAEAAANAFKDQWDRAGHVICVALDDPDDYTQKIEALEVEIKQREEVEWAKRWAAMTPEQRAAAKEESRLMTLWLLGGSNSLLEPLDPAKYKTATGARLDLPGDDK